MVDISYLGKSILIRSPNWLGDAVMTMPAVYHFVKQSDARISVLTHEKLADLWKMFPGIADVLTIDPCIRKTAQKLKNFSSAILLPNSCRTALEVFLAGIPVRLGYEGHWRKYLLTKSFKKKKKSVEENRHQKFDYVDLFREIGIGFETEVALPVLNKPHHEFSERNYLAVCPGAEYGPAKRWFAERFASVADEIATRYHLEILILGAQADIPFAETVKSNLKKDCLNKAGQTSLEEFMALIAHAKMVLCNDSGAMHLASAFRTPAIAIFGSTDPLLTGPLSESVKVVRQHVSCSPCFLRKCPIDFRCMERITSEEVIKLSEKILKTS